MKRTALLAVVLLAAACTTSNEAATTSTESPPTTINPLADHVEALTAERDALLQDVAILEEATAARHEHLTQVRQERDLYRRQLREAQEEVDALRFLATTTTTPTPTTTTGPPVPDNKEPVGGTGFFRVGSRMAPGVWKSTGSATDGCYWARLDENQEIIDNHYGAAGGSVNLRSSDFEFETEDCGGWMYEG
jgi:hypothetical protein